MDQLETQVSDLRSFLGAAAEAGPQSVRPGAAEIMSPLASGFGVNVAYSAAPSASVSGTEIGPGADGPLAAGGSIPGSSGLRRGSSYSGRSTAPTAGVAVSAGPGARSARGSLSSSSAAPGDNSAPNAPTILPSLPTLPALPTAAGTPPQQPPSPLEARANSVTSAASVSGSVSAAATTAKRRAEDGDGEPVVKQQRSKRNRYISIACNECKRRKIKCNGQTPCQRCGHLNLQCLYAPNCCSTFRESEEFKRLTEQVRQLQEHVNTLFNEMNALKQETMLRSGQDRGVVASPAGSGPGGASTLAPTPSSSSRQPSQAQPLPYRAPSTFHGPTSIAYTVDVAKNTLQNMGVADRDDSSGPQSASTPHGSPGLQPLTGAAPSPGYSQADGGERDPLWEFDEPEMMRLLYVFRDEVSFMWPVVSPDAIFEHAKQVCLWMSARRRDPAGGGDPVEQQKLFKDPQTLLLKLALCSGLLIEEHGNSPKADRLFASIQPIVDRMLMSEHADVNTLPILALVASYRYLSNDEVLAWRVIGHIARMCLELGLHRLEGLKRIADKQARKHALHTFWTTYILDRRWSFATGLPFVFHDDKIDPKLPYPNQHPFLVAMIDYSKLSAKIWKFVDYFEPAVTRELKPQDFELLDREIMAWYDSVPEEIRIDPQLDDDEIPLQASHRQRIWTRLRLNQARIWLYTPVLHSATSIAQNLEQAQKVVELAKKTICILTRLNQKTDLYRRMQVFYHQFLTSSIAVLFLASTHAPLQFSGMCRDEFYMALDLVKEMSARSWVSKRLWRTIKSLKAYAPSLGLDAGREHRSSSGVFPIGSAKGVQSTTSSQSPDSASHAGSAFGGTLPPGHHHSSPTPVHVTQAPILPSQSQILASSGDSPSDGVQLHTEMSRIFEGYIGFGMGSHVGGLGINMVSSAPGDAAGYSSAPPVTGVSTPDVEMVYAPPPQADGLGIGMDEGNEPGQGVYMHVREMF